MDVGYWSNAVGISDFVGHTFKEIRNLDDELIFISDTGDVFRMYHPQDCCESVYIDEIHGDLDDLLGTPILFAEESSNVDEGEQKSEYDDQYQWTFYKISSIKGSVTIRWYGSSNGYYSTSVYIYQGKTA